MSSRDLSMQARQAEVTARVHEDEARRLRQLVIEAAVEEFPDIPRCPVKYRSTATADDGYVVWSRYYRCGLQTNHDGLHLDPIYGFWETP